MNRRMLFKLKLFKQEIESKIKIIYSKEKSQYKIKVIIKTFLTSQCIMCEKNIKTIKECECFLISKYI